MCENRIKRLKRDEVTGKISKQDPLSKTSLSRFELEEILNNTNINAFLFFDDDEDLYNEL